MLIMICQANCTRWALKSPRKGGPSRMLLHFLYAVVFKKDRGYGLGHI